MFIVVWFLLSLHIYAFSPVIFLAIHWLVQLLQFAPSFYYVSLLFGIPFYVRHIVVLSEYYHSWKCNIWIGCTSIVVSVDPFKSNLLLMIDIKYCRTYNADIDMSTYNVIVVISHTRYIILIFTSQQLFHDEQQIIEIFYIHVT